MKYRPEIDGLRALAVIPVIFFHAGFDFFQGGFVGVDVFFVISGYLIASLIFKEISNKQFSLLNFYERRARRLLPALFLVIFFSSILSWFILSPSDFKGFGQSLVAVSLFSSNFLFWLQSGYFEASAELKPLLHTWSLAVEEQYYILFPIFIVLFWSRGLKLIIFLLVLIFVASLSLAHWGAYNYPEATFYLLPARIWELLLGVFIAIFLRINGFYKSITTNQLFSLLGFILIIISIVSFDKLTPFPSLYALIPTFGAGLLIIFAVPGTFIHKIFTSKPLVLVGLISYSAYLWHQPLLAFSRHRFMIEPSEIILFSVCVLSLILAFFTWKFIEQPFRSRKKVSTKTVAIYSFSSILFFSIIGLTIHFDYRLIKKFPQEVMQVQEIRINSIQSTKLCESSLSQESLNKIFLDCLIGHKDKAPSYALIGDSHARSLVPAIENTSLKKGFSGINLTHASCFPSVKESFYIPLDDIQRKCFKARENIVSMIKRNILPKEIFLFARWTITFEQSRFDNKEGGIEHGASAVYRNKYMQNKSYKESITQDIEDLVSLLKDNGHEVTIIYPTPEAGWDPAKMLIKYYQYNEVETISNLFASTSSKVFFERNQQTLTMLDELVEDFSLKRFVTHKYFCDLPSYEGRCLTIFKSLPLYYDDDHLSLYGGMLITDEILEDLSRDTHY
jgi:peptidoglycan/LPS O-acetylase OafA/YrhL